MSNEVAIKIEGLGKRYRYGGVAPLSANLRADLMEWAKGLLRRPDHRPKTIDSRPTGIASSEKSKDESRIGRDAVPGNSEVRSQDGGTRSVASAAAGEKLKADSRELTAPATHESLKQVHERHIAESPDYFWALKDINLEIKQGEVVGIIGRNGAGKSTLLKILSRITPPTTGKITYHGRVASLLEVGTGFHRELSGRENIYLNGSILGMKRAEIAKKFDEIVAFAEVDKFIDTPVKFYSSGMYVRLAFAVAANLDSEIMVVDEVLAVGDSEFQKKCLGKMGEVTKGGRTVLFVSHNMTAIESLCNHGAYFHEGALRFHGNIKDTVESYVNDLRKTHTQNAVSNVPIGSILELEQLQFNPNPVTSGEAVSFRVVLRSKQAARITDIVILIYTSHGSRAAIMDLRPDKGAYDLSDSAPLCITGEIPQLTLGEDEYQLGLYIRGTDFNSDLLDLAPLSVTHPIRENRPLPYPRRDRGVAELPFRFLRQ